MAQTKPKAAYVLVKRSTLYLDSVVCDGACTPQGDMSRGWFVVCVPSNSDSRTPKGTGPSIGGTGKVAIRYGAEPYVAGAPVNPVLRGLCRAKTIIVL